MRIQANKRSTLVRYFAASLLFLIICIRFYSMGDHIGIAIYTVTTGVSLVMAFAQLAKKE